MLISTWSLSAVKCGSPLSRGSWRPIFSSSSCAWPCGDGQDFGMFHWVTCALLLWILSAAKVSPLTFPFCFHLWYFFSYLRWRSLWRHFPPHCLPHLKASLLLRRACLLSFRPVLLGYENRPGSLRRPRKFRTIWREIQTDLSALLLRIWLHEGNLVGGHNFDKKNQNFKYSTEIIGPVGAAALPEIHGRPSFRWLDGQKWL